MSINDRHSMEQFVLIPCSVYQSQSTLSGKQKLDQKQEKEEIVLKMFDSVYTALKARLKTDNNKHLTDPILVFNKNAKAKDRGTWIPFKI